MKQPTQSRARRALASVSLIASLTVGAFVTVGPFVHAAPQEVREGSPVSPAHRDMYERGLAYIVSQQKSNGGFSGDSGVDGICVMALLASGEDPNFGRYAAAVQGGLRRLIDSQSGSTGQIGSGMYQHGFAMLCLADCYGAVDDRLLLRDGRPPARSVGEALELAVRCALTSQAQNPFHAWRYSPNAKDADTSAAGAVMMGLLGARNAGIGVPDEAIQQALGYFSSMTSTEGTVGYSGIGSFGGSLARSSISALVFAVAKQRDDPAFKSASEYVITERDRPNGFGHPCYTRYYVSQALFQVDHAAWREWSVTNTRDLIERQADDGSLTLQGGTHGKAYQTGMLLLSSALDYTFLPVYER